MAAESHTPQISQTATARGRTPFIPVLKPDLVERLSEQGLPRDQAADFQTLCTFLGAYFHHDFYDELTELKDIYAWFAPNGPRPVRHPPVDPDATYRKLCTTLEGVLTRANFIELPQVDVASLGGDHPLLDVKTRTPLEAYETIRIFVRGSHDDTLAQASPLGFKPKLIPTETYDDVVVFVRFKQPEGAQRRKLPLGRRRGLPGNAEPGSVMIKLFRNISRVELPTLLPDVQVVMSRKDAVLLGGPALLGGVPVMLNLLPALSVVLVVIGAYLGFSGAVSQDQLQKAVGALAVLIGAGAFMFRQYSNYSFRKLKYQKRVSDNVYFKNVNNNAGVFETLINAAEEQETKEVILAYHVLLTSGSAANAAELDHRIEAWLKSAFGIDVDFEVSDALRKLEGLGFLAQNEGRIAVVPLPDALARLDTLWDRLYDFGRGPRSSAAA
jgi:hypothetical protein